MNLISVFGLVTATVLTAVPARSQQPKKIPTIGVLSALSPRAVSAWVQAFQRGLHDLGYVEGKNIVIHYRYAEGNVQRLGELAAELGQKKVDVIVRAAL